jgi:hypothetical protein
MNNRKTIMNKDKQQEEHCKQDEQQEYHHK